MNRDSEIQIPTHVQLKPTTSCNLRCRTCSLWHTNIESGLGEKPADERLADDEVLALIDHLSDWGVKRLEIADGEPFLRPGSVRFLARAAEKGLDTLAITNGTLIDEPLADRLVADRLGTVVISLDGPASLHDRLRGVDGTFERLAIGVRALLNAKQSAGGPHPRLMFHCTVSRLNYTELTGVVEAAAGLGVPAVIFRYLSRVPPRVVDETNSLLEGPYASPAHHYSVEEDLRISDQDTVFLRKSLDQLISASGTLDIQVGIDPLLVRMGGTGRVTERTFDTTDCPLIEDFLQISPGGTVHPCPMLTGCGLGNVRQRNVKDIFNDSHSRTLRRTIQRNFPLPICPHCCYRER